MNRVRAGLVALTMASAALLTSCAGVVADAYVIENDPGSVEVIEGSDLSRVILTEAAAERLEVRTTQVEAAGQELVVPSDAIFVDPDGVWWVYTNPEPFVYLRHEIAVEREVDGQAFLSSGPDPGTMVVIVGVPEIYGVEAAVGH